MLRFAPLVSPVMHKVKVETRYFFVPTRILDPIWEKWITGESDAERPYIIVEEVLEGSLADYLGLPVGTYATNLRVSPYPFAAYLKIWNEYYRDQNLQDEIDITIVPGDNTTTFADYLAGNPLRRAWNHDYFTAALPFAQKGDAVQVPLTVQNDIEVQWESQGTGTAAENAGLWRRAATGAIETDVSNIVNATGPVPLSRSAQTATGNVVSYDPNGTLRVDVQSDAVDINTLRRAFRLQEWLERNARGGTRYIENILAHFGIKSSDARLQRPEYMGGSKQNMIISEVLSTAQNDTGTVPVGQMAGHGISVGGGNTFGKFCEEHGYILGIINVQPVTAYQDGVHRLWTRETHLDYPWPTFANLGEQEVYQKELFARGANPDALFGYVPRYAEMKFMNSRVAGEMRDALKNWTWSRIFTTEQNLNAAFVECNPRTDQFAVTDPDEDHLFAHIFNNVYVTRKLPKFGTPTI